MDVRIYLGSSNRTSSKITRPIFFHHSSRFAVIYQLFCSRTTADRLYYDWIVEKNLVENSASFLHPVQIFPPIQSFCCRLSVVLLSYDSRSALLRLDRRKKFGRADRQTDRQTDRQIGRQTDRQTEW